MPFPGRIQRHIPVGYQPRTRLKGAGYAVGREVIERNVKRTECIHPSKLLNASYSVNEGGGSYESLCISSIPASLFVQGREF